MLLRPSNSSMIVNSGPSNLYASRLYIPDLLAYYNIMFRSEGIHVMVSKSHHWHMITLTPSTRMCYCS